MNKTFIWLLTGLLLVSCDKIQKTEKTLTGVWTVFSYKVTNAQGFSYYYPASGTVDFGSCGDALCHYAIRIDYIKDGQNLQKYEDGKIHLEEDHYFTLDRINPDGSTTFLDYGRFLLMTKDDIQLHFSDESGVNELVLQR